ncbi:PLP-dependent aminotransferase family protein [Curvibacter sp. HBC61]|uniref:PLP-dependent aminotransferase family protein n=1 Tax=Curvibacter cyanobacteriorum TaxID=3026422 RepID=A0ABT5N3I8_9BURK|nr:PLP-dependent aminotransferase family protein [Curvibacter sp. HBC61]MDD0840888.1 PLP-dependent aminotransferase family protein [Curvibacter sp. HBC61]
MTQYERLADEFQTLIHNGTLRVGDRLPSVRVTCARRHISPATVFQAYYLLESRGLVQARPRSGYFVAARRPEALAAPEVSSEPPPSQSVAVNDLVVEVLKLSRRAEVLPLGSAFPDPALFPLAKLGRSLGSAMRRLPPHKLVEDLATGHARLRQQVAQRLAADGLAVSADELVVTNGAMEALNLCLQAVTQPGDLVVLESPTFYASLQALERLQLQALALPTHPEHGIDLAALAQALATQPVKACWLMSSFQNPLGALMPEAKKQAIADLLARHQVPLIEDDVYGELYFGPHKPRPIKAFDRAGWVLHCGSFSKSLAPGYRVGWAAAGRWSRAVERAKVMSSLSAAVPSQVAISDYLAQGGHDLHLRRLRQTLQQQRDVALAAIAEHFPAGTQATRPEGGYLLWVALPGDIDTRALLPQALEAGVSLMPGALFSADQRFAHCLRLNYGAVGPDGLRDALARLGRLICDRTGLAPLSR